MQRLLWWIFISGGLIGNSRFPETGVAVAAAWSIDSYRPTNRATSSLLSSQVKRRGGSSSSDSSSKMSAATSSEQGSTTSSLPWFVKVIGVTGGIGSGKSTACRLLESGELWMSDEAAQQEQSTTSAALYLDADSMAHGLYSPGSPVVKAIAQAFGTSVLNPETGDVNRPALGALIFNNAQARKQLENIVWPILKDNIWNRIQRAAQDWETAMHHTRRDSNKFCIVIVEAALLLDAGWDDFLDATWIVTASRKVALNRLVQGDRKMAQEDVERRMAAQEARFGNLSELQEQGIVTAVIDNSQSSDELRQALQQALQQALETWESESQPPKPSS